MADLRLVLRAVNSHPVVKTTFAVCLVFALFAGNMWQVGDFPDDPSNAILDVVMVTVLVLFIVEIVLNCIVDRFYIGSFFFCMDILGTASMVFEISFLFGVAGKINQNDSAVDPVIMRTARVAKTAARAGRFLKITKCLEIIVRRQGKQPGAVDTAKTLSHKLMLTLSTKVSLLTITLVIIVPIFQIGQYPEEDLSMKAWGRRLEEKYRQAYNFLEQNPAMGHTDIFAEVITDMQSFYSTVDYFPYMLEGYSETVRLTNRSATILGASFLEPQEAPVRKQTIVKQVVYECLTPRAECGNETKAAVYFNFASSKRLEAGMESAMAIFVIFVMAFLTSDLSQTIDRLVVKPLERMLSMVREVASTIMNLVKESKDGGEAPVEDINQDTPDEMLMLEQAFEELSKISSICLQDRKVDEQEIAEMGAEAKGVVVDLMMMESRKSDTPTAIMSMLDSQPITPQKLPNAETLVVRELPVTLEKIESWELNVLELSEVGQEQLALYIVFDSQIGSYTGAQLPKVHTFKAFFEAAMKGYKSNPYHNAIHACDVMHSVYRLLCLTSASMWASDVDTYALLVAALCHDIGHMGKTNPFLVEVGHELALFYNDASPLENMHVANMFKICDNANTDVFSQLDVASFKRARKVCVTTILHTDNSHHFAMVKDISKAYEIASDIIERQAARPDEMLTAYQRDVLEKDTLLFLQLFLHFSDVSNPLKPFDICRAWAWRVLDEFFAQGDEEKQLGIPVGMLNDRDKVNKPGSQHGFVNFLVAPLVFATVRLFPTLHPLATQMAANLQEWRGIWVDEANPDSEAVVKRDAEVQKVATTAEELQRRTVAAEPVTTRGSLASLVGAGR